MGACSSKSMKMSTKTVQATRIYVYDPNGSKLEIPNVSLKMAPDNNSEGSNSNEMNSSEEDDLNMSRIFGRANLPDGESLSSPNEGSISVQKSRNLTMAKN